MGVWGEMVLVTYVFGQCDYIVGSDWGQGWSRDHVGLGISPSYIMRRTLCIYGFFLIRQRVQRSGQVGEDVPMGVCVMGWRRGDRGEVLGRVRWGEL